MNTGLTNTILQVTEVRDHEGQLLRKEFKADKHTDVKIWPSGMITLKDEHQKPQSIIGLDKDDAIQLAKLILIENNVPFCNRVKGAGTVG